MDNYKKDFRAKLIAAHLTFPLLAVSLLSSFGSSMLYGYNLAVVNSPSEHIKAFYNATWIERYGESLESSPLTILYSLTVSVFALGGMLGSLCVGVLVSRFGRKGTIIRSSPLVFIGGALMGFSRMLRFPEMVIIGRFIIGIHSGISLSVVPMYLGEVSPKNLRGFLGLMPSIFICLGVFTAQVLGLPELLGKDETWPLFLAMVVVPTFVQICTLHFFPESPRYLLIDKSNIHATIHALRRFRGKHDVQDVIEEMQEEQRSLTSVKNVSVCQLLLDRTLFWQILSVIVINMGMQLSGIDASYKYPSHKQKLTSLLPPATTRGSMIWFYTNSIFENAGIALTEIPYTTVGTGAVEIIAGLTGCFTVEKLGRRPLIIGGFSFMGFCCAGITVALVFQARITWMRYASVVFVIGIIAGFCIGPAGLPFIITGELFMQSHRPAAYIVGGTLNWLSNFTVGFVFPFLQESAGAFCYLVFCGVCLFVAVYVYFVIPETKNKTFLEISEMFSSRRSLSEPVIPYDDVKLRKLNGYGTLESSSLENSMP